MTTYLLNTPLLTNYGEWRFIGPLNPEEARIRIGSGFISAIGHESSAQFLSQLLGTHVPMNRISITMETGDSALVLRIKVRMQEGRQITHEELENIPYELAWLEKVS